jgi:hypothetical protein
MSQEPKTVVPYTWASVTEKSLGRAQAAIFTWLFVAVTVWEVYTQTVDMGLLALVGGYAIGAKSVGKYLENQEK